MPEFRILESEPGIAGYTIFAFNNKTDRRTALSKTFLFEAMDDDEFPGLKWPEGAKFNIPGIGKGIVIIPDPIMPLVKIGDYVPNRFPARGLRKEPPRRKPQRTAPRTQINYEELILSYR